MPKVDPLILFTQLKGKKEKLQQELSRLEGKEERVLTELVQEFGCEGLEAARNLSSQLEREEEELGGKFTRLVEKFQQRWHHELERP